LKGELGALPQVESEKKVKTGGGRATFAQKASKVTMKKGEQPIDSRRTSSTATAARPFTLSPNAERKEKKSREVIAQRGRGKRGVPCGYADAG